ncbi:MAG: anaerobic ribonucleoside-triphosphate reductase activating protein [Candidatus Bathyarchaeota archaeon]
MLGSHAGMQNSISNKEIWRQKGLPIVRHQRLSLRDWSGRLCAKTVVPGCNFRCPYCSQRALIYDYLGMDRVPEWEVLDHLYRVKGYLTGVCIGGGEPTLHNGLLQFCYKVKSIGYDIKIDTNGTRPKRLRKLMEEKVVDYIAMEIKAPIDRYPEVVKHKVNKKAVEESIKLLRRGNIDYEFSITMVPDLIGARELKEIANILIGSRRFVIRRHQAGDCLDTEFSGKEPYSKRELEEFRDQVAPYFAKCVVNS